MDIRAENPPAEGPPPRPNRSSVAGFVAKYDGGDIKKLGRAPPPLLNSKGKPNPTPAAVGPTCAAFCSNAVADKCGDGGAAAKGRRRSREEEKRERGVGSKDGAVEENKLTKMLVPGLELSPLSSSLFSSTCVSGTGSGFSTTE